MMDLKASKNLLLSRLSRQERLRLQPYAEAQPMAFKQTLVEQGKPVPYIYFVEDGVASIVTDLADGETVETGMVGNEGLVGLSAVLGARVASSRVFCQIPGHAIRLPAAIVAKERVAGSVWFQLLLRYAHFMNAVTAQSAACNRMHAVDARMSRWLLMSHDRVVGDTFPVTQEFLARMLGVARPTVNIAGAILQKAELIAYTRGRMTVLDRAGLEASSCECYRRIREELDRLVNGQPSPTKRRRRAARKRSAKKD